MNNDERIRQIVRQEMQESKSGSRFGLNPIQRHVHNGVDSPYAFQPSITYGGFIESDGAVSLLPKGWLCEQVSTGNYTITHNLNSQLYFVVASAQQSTNAVVTPVIESFQNTTSFGWFVYDSGGPIALDTAFNFLLFLIGNKNAQVPSYTGTLAP